MARRPDLEARLAANRARLQRLEVTARLQSLGALVAGIADRFALHWHDGVHKALLAWTRRSLPLHGPYTDRRIFEGQAAPALSEVLADLIEKHALSGWAELFGGFDGHDLALAAETPALAALVPALREEDPGAFADTVIVSRSRDWALMVHHEGEVLYWAFDNEARV